MTERSDSPSATIVVVIPAYRVARHIENVINRIPSFIQHIIVVEDASPDNSAELVERLANPRVTLVRHERNQGVGGAMISGYRKALELGADIVVKMDGDDQMDPECLPRLLEPLLSMQADYAKGNRFSDLAALRSMPPVRRWGNTALTFLVKVASGYWNVCDPTNGYTALRCEALRELDLSRVHRSYFFETSMLINLNIIKAVVADVSIPSRYGDEESSLRISRILMEFPPRLLQGLFQRYFWKYIMIEFAPQALFSILGIPLFLFGLLFGCWRWAISISQGIIQSTGTVMIAVLPLLMGFQLLLTALVMDMLSVPRLPLSKSLSSPRLSTHDTPHS